MRSPPFHGGLHDRSALTYETARVWALAPRTAPAIRNQPAGAGHRCRDGPFHSGAYRKRGPLRDQGHPSAAYRHAPAPDDRNGVFTLMGHAPEQSQAASSLALMPRTLLNEHNQSSPSHALMRRFASSPRAHSSHMKANRLRGHACPENPTYRMHPVAIREPMANRSAPGFLL